MKVYLVLNHYGSYDSSYVSTDKIFSTNMKAVDYVSKVKLRIEELKSLYNNMSDHGHDENDDIYQLAEDKFDEDFPDTYFDNWDGNLFTIAERDLE